MSGPRTRVLLVDDQRLVREGFAALLSSIREIEVVGAVARGADAVDAARRLRPDVVVMDLVMPGMSGAEATRRLRAERPDVQVIALTAYEDDEHIFGAIEAGARGYLTKDATVADVRRAITAVGVGAGAFDARVQARLADAVEAGRRRPRPSADALTPRELEVLRLAARGRSNAEIGRELYITEATVKRHLHNVFEKLGLRDRTQAVAYAFRNGLAG
jgi:DNA-binding NarL/FixJ family response regulator